MNCEDIPVTHLIQAQCREIPNRIDKIRVYRRIPRKLKKRIKKQRRFADSLVMMYEATKMVTTTMNVMAQCFAIRKAIKNS